MSGNRVVWDGMAEYRAQLLALPESCTGEAALLTEGTVNGVFTDIGGAYPVREGELRAGMRIVPVTKKGLVVAAAVKNVAKHATIFESGSQTRHYVTVNGKKHLTGRMPPGHVFVPRIVRARRRLTEQLKAMVLRHGATTVTGDA